MAKVAQFSGKQVTNPYRLFQRHITCTALTTTNSSISQLHIYNNYIHHNHSSWVQQNTSFNLVAGGDTVIVIFLNFT